MITHSLSPFVTPKWLPTESDTPSKRFTLSVLTRIIPPILLIPPVFPYPVGLPLFPYPVKLCP